MEINKETIERILKEANIARKSLVIYPESHPTSLSRIQGFFSLLRDFLEESSITLGLKSDRFQWGEEEIKLENPAIQEFHSLLKNHQILAIQLSKEIEIEDIKKFFRLISLSPERIASEGGFRSVAEREKLNGISFVFLDLQLAEIKDEEIIKAHKDKSESERDILLRSLLLKPSILILDPTIEEKVEKIIKSSENIEEIKNILLAIESAIQNASDEEAVPAYRFLLSILSIPLREEYALWLKDLGKRNPSLLKRIASNVPKRILMEALRIVKEMGVEKRELEIFHSLIFEKNRERIENFFRSSVIVDDIPISMEESYTNILNEIMERIILPSPFPDLKEEAWKELSEEKMRENLFKLDLEALDWEVDENEFTLIVQRLLDYYWLFLQTAQFEKVRILISAFEEPRKEDWKNKILKSSIEIMKSRDTIKLLIENSKEVWGKEKIEEIKSIFHFIGVEAVPLLVEALIEEEDKYTRRVLIDIISELGITPEIARANLKSDKWYVVRNMLVIIRNTGGREFIDDVIKCTEHPHLKVKMEAIRTLSQLGYERTDEILLKFIESPDINLKIQALSIVPALRLTSLIPYLNNYLKEMKLKSENIPLIISLIRTLGDIGDKSSIPIIKRFLRGSIFYPARTKLLKREVYNSLDGYPYDEIKDLIEKGLKSRDKEVAEISYRLSRRIPS